ncbi:MAG: NUDIX hydrolase, partial [Burkholderiales bacterium]
MVLIPNRDWLAARLERAADLPHAQGRIEQAMLGSQPAVPAAVLVPLIARGAGVNVLFTQRTAHLADHAGQISFPGGRVEAGDMNLRDTALREAQEEIGLPRESVVMLGELPDYYIPTGFRITPVVGWVEAPFEIKLDSFEVAETFEAPLAFFLDPANHQSHDTIYQGQPRQY